MKENRLIQGEVIKNERNSSIEKYSPIMVRMNKNPKTKKKEKKSNGKKQKN